MDLCKECDKGLTAADKAISTNGQCFSCNLTKAGSETIRERPIWHHTKKMYQGGRL